MACGDPGRVGVPFPVGASLADARGRGATFLALALALAFLSPLRAAHELLLDAARTGTDLVAVGERGTILRSSDEAASWTAAPVPTRTTLTAVTFAPDSPVGWAVGHDAIILSTADAGRTWSVAYQGGNREDSFLDVLALDAQHVWAVGAFGLCLTSADGGKTWQPRKPTDEDAHLNRISVGPTGTLYLAGERGTLLRSADRGATWTPIPAPYAGSFYGILPLDRRTLVAHGLRGHVFRSADDGATWQPVAISQPVLLATAVRLKSNHVVLGGAARALFVSRDYGTTFVPVDAPPATAAAELLELTGGRLLALGEAGATVLPAP